MKNVKFSKINIKYKNNPPVLSEKEFKRNNKITTLMMLFVIIMSFWLGIQFSEARTSNEFSAFIEVKNTIDTHYNLGEYDEEAAMNNAIAAYVASIGDKYAFYLAPEKHDLLVQQSNGNYIGIGISFQKDENHNTTITDVVENSPATKAGIKVGDTLIRIKDITIAEYEGTNITKDLNLKNGDEIKVLISRENEEIEFTVKIETITKKQCSLTYHNNIAHIYLSTFSETSAHQLAEILKEINNNKECEGIILDLRDNGGGLLTSLKQIASNFLDNKEIARFDYKEMFDETITTSRSENFTDLEMVVLVNENTASASECLTGALKHYGRAKIVGKTTFGKGIGQSTIVCKNGNYLKLTTSKYYLPNGECIHEKGITPDIEIDLKESIKSGDVKLTFENDDQLHKALEIFKK